MGYYGFRPYVRVADRLAKAERKMKQLAKKGKMILPVEIQGRKIATTFWGKAWCDHIEMFGDYENRLPRGRAYACNGSVCHLAIAEKKIEAMVAGSEIYSVEINIKPLADKKWRAIKRECSGKIGSLLELLGGKFSDEVMSVVCDFKTGLFPAPNEIKLSCSCPDWAQMCKHVAAALYGIAARLDHNPAQLFQLRGVNYQELIDVQDALLDVAGKDGSSRKRIDDAALSDVFGIEMMVDNFANENSENKRTKPRNKKRVKGTSAKTKSAKSKQVVKKSNAQPKKSPKYFTGKAIREKRKELKLTQIQFAELLNVSAAAISQWENKGSARLTLQRHSEGALRELWNQ